MPGTKNLKHRLRQCPDMQGSVEEEFDMVVLSLGLEPSANASGASATVCRSWCSTRWGFAETTELSPLDTSRPGVFVGGAFQEPKDIPDTVMQASAAAARAMALLAKSRGTRVRTKTYPPERDLSDEPSRVGVFVCHCGSNIASVVDVARVVAHAKTLPHVAWADSNTYTCADDSQERMKQAIREHRLNRVVVASCTPRTHEAIFRDTLRDVGLNPFLLDMANIRDQCSWVHSGNPDAATEKACGLVRMAVGRAANLQPLAQETVPVDNAALVVGGGIAGITAALALAEQGFPVHLVEKAERLGGTASQIHSTLDGSDVQATLAEMIQRVLSNAKISVYLESRVSKVDGHVGHFTSKAVTPQGEIELKHGVVVVATGATELKPKSYGYGANPKVVTQLELTERLGQGQMKLPDRPTVVMIQCVEQRDQERPYCSRVCCTSAVKNALAIKKAHPQAQVVVLYRDMRTYGFREAAYRQAREQGVLFVRYEPERAPQLEANGEVRFWEPSVRREIVLTPDLVVLAAPMVPRADRGELSDLLRVPLNADGFFLEAHMKLRPVDFASEGLFLCGTAHAPKFIGEAISQANAVAARAASVLSKQRMPVGGQTAWVDPDKCISCMTCVHLCPYMAPRIDGDHKAEVQSAVCMGCGSCTAECPAKAISLRHFVDAQILGAMNQLLGVAGEELIDVSYPGRAGVTPARWHARSR